MSVELRAGRYAYLKRKVGGRVVSEYLGSGSAAVLMVELDRIWRERRQTARWDWLLEKRRMGADDRALAEWCGRVRDVATAAMVAAGYRRHKRQWRKRRNVSEITKATQPSPTAKITGDELHELLNRAGSGDVSCVPRLLAVFRDKGDVLACYGNPSS